MSSKALTLYAPRHARPWIAYGRGWGKAVTKSPEYARMVAVLGGRMACASAQQLASWFTGFGELAGL